MTETHTFKNVVLRTTRSGWFGTPSYCVAVTAIHRRTHRTVTLKNTTPWCSPHHLRRTAAEQLEEK